MFRSSWGIQLGRFSIKQLGFPRAVFGNRGGTVDGQILHDLKDSKLWELWYIPYNG